jgi:hypothetical protein
LLKLVIDNTKQSKEASSTCRTTCSLYDPVMQQCGIFSDVEVTNPEVYARCQMKVPHSYNQNKQHYSESFKQIWFEPAGANKLQEQMTYPAAPGIDSPIDAEWYVDPSKEFGCWLINKSTTLSLVQDASHFNSSNTYQSAVPLHNHSAPPLLQSKMCWYVNEEGYGQYVLLNHGRVQMISQPMRPK